MSAEYLELNAWQVAAASLLVAINAVISLALGLGLEKSLLLASIRTVAQLLLIGYVLSWVFRTDDAAIVVAIMVCMTLIAGVTAFRRTELRYPGMLVNTIVSIAASSWSMLAFALFAVLGSGTDWYAPQYSIPLLGMLLGNTLNGVTLGLQSAVESLSTRRDRVEALLTLGATRWEAARDPLRHAVRTGMVPIINSMMVVGLVSLPGMMTGQLLAGVDPMQAIRYQIVIMFLIAAATALGVVGVVVLTFSRLFTAHHQFRYDLIKGT